MEISMKDVLVDFLKSSNQIFYLDLMISNFKLNPKTFELEEFFSDFYIAIDLNFQVEAVLNFHKLTVSKKYEFDIFEYEFSDISKYKVDQDSFKLLKLSRDLPDEKNGNTSYGDYIYFNYSIFEETNEVTFLTFDDIMAVLGGFTGIIFAAAEFFAGLYNEEKGERLIMRYLEKKYDKYDESFNNARNSITTQIDYFETYLLNKNPDRQQKENNNNNNNNNTNKVFFDDRFDKYKKDDNFNRVSSNYRGELFDKKPFESQGEKLLNNNPNNVIYKNVMRVKKNKSLNEDMIHSHRNYHQQGSKMNFDINDDSKANCDKNMDRFFNEKSRHSSYYSLKTNNNRIKELLDEQINQEFNSDEKKIPLKTSQNMKRMVDCLIQEQEGIHNKHYYNENAKVLKDSYKFDFNSVRENQTLANKLSEEYKNYLTAPVDSKDLDNKNNIKNNYINVNGSYNGDSSDVNKKQMNYIQPGQVEDLKILELNDYGKWLIFNLSYII